MAKAEPIRSHAAHARRRFAWARRYTCSPSSPKSEAGHFGEYVAIDVDTEGWVVADTTRAAVEHLRARHPSAVDIVCERVGYRALRSFGAGSLRRTG